MPKTLRFGLLLGLIVLLSLTVPGCFRRNQPKESGTPTPIVERNGIPGGVFRMVIGGNPQTLDPAFITDCRDGSLSALLYNGLVRYADNGLDLVPDIADWEVSKDGTVYTFHLQKGVKFTNGREVTAADFKYSFERVLHPATGSPRRWVFLRVLGAQAFADGTAKEVKGLKAKDQYTLEITLEQPYAVFLPLLAMPAGYVVPREEVEKKAADFGRQPVGTGPFVLQEWVKNEALTFAANERYFAAKPYLTGIDVGIVTDSRSYAAQFERGDLETIPLSGTQLATMRANSRWIPYLASQPDLSVFYLAINCQKAPVNNVKVRQALNYAINREKLSQLFGDSQATLARGPIPRNVAGYNAGLAGYEYNPQKAKVLLAEAGWKSGTKLRLWQSRSKGILQLTTAIQKDLKAVGINLEIIQGEWSELGQAFAGGTADLAYLSWWADYPEAENFLYPVFHSANSGAKGNRAYYADAAVDEAIETAMLTAGEGERLLQYAAIEKSIVEAAPWVFLWHSQTDTVVQPWVRGYTLHPIYNGNKMTEVWLDPAAKAGQ